MRTLDFCQQNIVFSLTFLSIKKDEKVNGSWL